MINKNQLKASFLLAMMCLVIKIIFDVLDHNSMGSKFMTTINLLGASGFWYMPILVGVWYVFAFTFSFYLFFRILNLIVHFVLHKR